MFTPPFRPAALSLLLLSGFACADDVETSDSLEAVSVTAERRPQQQFDRSLITEKDLERTPVVNDISEIVRKQPGVNLTSGSSSGQRGNKRQIDIRSMGPDNTLILIDGRPVKSRNGERYGRGGARNSRGDSNWVPAEEIESVEVIRGTAANRYGSGAMGGVVNIRTKPVADSFGGGVYTSIWQPQDSSWGSTRRAGFHLGGPIVRDVLGFKLYGNINKTKSDDFGINRNPDGSISAAGREGVRNKDIAGRLAWKINPDHNLTLDASYSRQGNIYTGDSEFGGEPSEVLGNKGLETARLYRQAYALTHKGVWAWGEGKTYVQYDRTVNSRYPEGLGFSFEGGYTGDRYFTDSILNNVRVANETVIPFDWGVKHRLTVGGDWNRSALDDSASMNYKFDGFMNLGQIPWLPAGKRSGKISQIEFGLFAEDAMDLGQGTTLTPSLRFDHHSNSGSNWSPALNASHAINDKLILHAGIARAYKAPNLYQSSENYVLANRQNNCPLAGLPITEVGACYTVGNGNLKPETSINKEIGFDFRNKGYAFGMTYFHNKYRNKIEADENILATIDNPSWRRVRKYGKPNEYVYTTHIYKWDNVARATVAGLEGYFNLPLIRDRLDWQNTFTYMHKSQNKRTGNPLNISPKYSIHSTLSYKPSQNWEVSANYSFYGRQVSPGRPERYMQVLWNSIRADRLGGYGIFGLNAGYHWKKTFSIRAGISNLFDKKLFKDGDNQAKTYNEPGRTFYTTLKFNF